MKPTLSFFIPIYNKEKSIQGTIDTIIEASKLLDISYEIIAIDDGSLDQSWNILQKLQPNYKNLLIYKNDFNIGFANTYFKSIEFASGEYGLYLSADDDISKDQLIKVLSCLGNEPIIIQTFSNISDRPFIRKIISASFTHIMNLSHDYRLDYYNGCNIFPLSFLKSYNNIETSFAFQAELLSNALKEYAYMQVPIEGSFADDHSSAFNMKNIWGVISYLSKKI